MHEKGLAAKGDEIDSNYTLMGGTSMAAPLAAGAAALVRQFYQEEKKHDPSAALVKATLVNSATNMTPSSPRPDNNQGWGRINLEYSLFPPAPREFLYYDEPNGLSEDIYDLVNFEVTDSNEELRVTLVWTDPPENTIQNDLDISLTEPNTVVSCRYDSLNNIEGIDIKSPQTGTWSVLISAKTTPFPPQPYALIIAGAVSESSAPYPPSDFTASAISPSENDLTWSKNKDGDNVIIAYNTVDVFEPPVNGTAYPVGSLIGSAKVIYNGAGTDFPHTDLVDDSHYYYRAWSVNSNTEYSTAVQANLIRIPYTESFETSFGVWIDISGYEGDWTRISGETPSSHTGPKSAHDCSYYIYTSASGNPEKTAIIEASFDFSSVSEPVLSFYYHMYGSDIGSLCVDVNDVNGYKEVWSASGQQQTSTDAPWIQAEVNLSDFRNDDDVIIRFRGITHSEYDIALDNIVVWNRGPTLELSGSGTNLLQNISIGTTPSDIPFEVWNSGYGSLGYTVSTDVSWLSVSPTSGLIEEAVERNDVVTISFDTDELTVGLYTGKITVKSAEAANSPSSIGVDVNVYVPELDHFEWSPIATPQGPNVPFDVEITAKDIHGYTVTSYESTVSIEGLINPGIVLFAEDFEDGNYDGWVNDGGNHTQQVTDETSAEGSYCLTLIGGDLDLKGIYHELSNIEPNYVDFYVRSNSTTMNDGYFALKESYPGYIYSDAAVAFYMKNDGTINVNGDNNELIPYDADEWYKISFIFNWSDKEVDFYVYDELIESGILFRDSKVDTLKYVHLNNQASGSQTWWDDIRFIKGDYRQISVPISPTNTGNFISGKWTGSLTVLDDANDMILRADDGNRHIGDSNTFKVYPPVLKE
jgi:hypothetical protein